MLVVVIISSLALFGVSLAAAEGECQSDCRNMVMPSAQCQLAHLLSFSYGTNLNVYKMPCKRDTLARSLDIFCSSDCSSSISTYYTCTGRTPWIIGQNINISYVIQLYCSRHADGTFCPFKILEESTSAGPLCSTQSSPSTSCNSKCEDYRLLSSRLGCCGGTWSSDSSHYGPLSGFKKYFDYCNVKLERPCERVSGAGVLYLSVLLVVAVSLLSTIIV